ncbi:hypothetical protein H0H81_012565, partial [Sphagnurus paluster]
MVDGGWAGPGAEGDGEGDGDGEGLGVDGLVGAAGVELCDVEEELGGLGEAVRMVSGGRRTRWGGRWERGSRLGHWGLIQIGFIKDMDQLTVAADLPQEAASRAEILPGACLAGTLQRRLREC